MVINEEIRGLFKRCLGKFGAPVRKVELTEEQLCQNLENAIEEYASMVQNAIVEWNWSNFYGKNMSNADIAYLFSVRTFDMAKDFSYYFSKQVGLQQNGPWELKKDFFEIECGKQSYVIPAGRMINSVLWITPPTTDAALFANFGGTGASFGNGVYGQLGIGATAFFGMSGAYGMGSGLWALPAADVAYMAADLKYKNSLIRSDLTYKVTAGPNGTHIIHLLSTPGAKWTFGNGGIGQYSLKNCYCWYTYYDDGGKSNECALDNPDVILTPDRIPLAKMEYGLLNEPTKVTVRKIFFAEAAETLAYIRGKFSGNINMISSPLTMDYNMLLTYAKDEKSAALNELKERLGRLSPAEQLKIQGEMVENVIKVKKGTPLGIYVI